MSKDGRLTIRFGKLIDDIRQAASKEDRSTGDWVRVQIKQLLRKNKINRRRLAAA
jgi:hypothetical protein